MLDLMLSLKELLRVQQLKFKLQKSYISNQNFFPCPSMSTFLQIQSEMCAICNSLQDSCVVAVCFQQLSGQKEVGAALSLADR